MRCIFLVVFALLAGAVACSPPPGCKVDADCGVGRQCSNGSCIGSPPPQVFITVAESNVIGGSVKGTVNVSGCKTVTQVQVLQADAFLADVNYTKSPTAFELPASLFSPLYSRLGIAASLTLKAKVICSDGRTNTSQPVPVTFFPVANKFSMGGTQVMPDAFVAEGGLGGTPTTFIGCVGTSTGTALARVDTMGVITAYNESLPFPCSYDTEISERSTVSGTRWVLEKDKGAYALDSNFNVVKVLQKKIQRMGVGETGTGVFWSNEINVEKLHKAEPVVSTANDWEADFAGIMNSSPVVDTRTRVIWASSWQYNIGTKLGDIVAFKINLDNGSLLNGNPGPPVLVRQSFAEINQPITPFGTFTSSGSVFVTPLLAVDTGGNVTTTILGCATGTSGCMNTARAFTSQTFPGVVNLVVPFSGPNYLAAAGPFQLWFLSSSNGTVTNLGGQPLRPSGSLQFIGLQPGLNKEFYALAGPNTAVSYPTEIVATDAPESGELWRLGFGSGESPTAGMYMAVDAAGQPWIRVGPDQVKPLPNDQYRMVRGPTILP